MTPGIVQNFYMTIKLVMEVQKLGKTSEIWLQGFGGVMRWFSQTYPYGHGNTLSHLDVTGHVNVSIFLQSENCNNHILHSKVTEANATTHFMDTLQE